MPTNRHLSSDAESDTDDVIISSRGEDLLFSPCFFGSTEFRGNKVVTRGGNESEGDARGAALEYMPLDVFQTDSGYTSLLSTPSRVGSSSGFSSGDNGL